MKAETRIFGTIEIEDEKIVTMEKGMIGFPELKHFALIFDEEKEEKEFTKGVHIQYYIYGFQ